MLTIKKYANGRFYDTDNKKYLKKEEVVKLVASKKKVKVVFSKTGKDITATLRPKAKSKARPKAKSADVRTKAKKTTEQVSASVKKWANENRKWLSDNLDKRIDRVLKVLNLPTKVQVNKLDKSIRALNKKVKDLEALQARKFKALEKAQKG